MTATSVRDFAHDETAETHRCEKARKLAEECARRELRVVPGDRVDRRHIEAAVGLTRRASDETWALAAAELAARWALGDRAPVEKTCGHWATDRLCGATPTRFFLGGHRCAAHTPAALASQPEASGGYRIPQRPVAERFVGSGLAAYTAARVVLEMRAGDPALCGECEQPLHAVLVAAGLTKHDLCGPDPDLGAAFAAWRTR